MAVFIGRHARAGEPTRLQYWRKHASGVLQRGLGWYTARWMRRRHVVRFGRAPHRLRLEVPVGVFPPRFFFSTALLGRLLRRMPLDGRTLLEIGSGSGAVSLTAASCGAKVTAIDISSMAVYATRRNAVLNDLEVDVRASDLFGGVDEAFDVIVVNPPYFRHDPDSELDHAFHAGAGFQYFHRLFGELGDHVRPGGTVLMALAEGCDAAIGEIAEQYGCRLELHDRSMSLLQWNYVFVVHC